MIPQRFAIEYPERCLELIDNFEAIARERDLYGTFSVMLAASILIIPWERANGRHPLTQEQGGGLNAGLRRLEKQRWLEAEFWQDAPTGDWRFSRIMGDPNDVRAWQDNDGRPSFAPEANTMNRRRVGEVFRVLRNALAHGNIVYLDGHGQETAGARVQHIAFLSRYEENLDQRAAPETYRMVAVRETDFLPFIRAWALWVYRHHRDEDMRVA